MKKKHIYGIGIGSIIGFIAYLLWGTTQAPTITLENPHQHISPSRPVVFNITSSTSPIQSVSVTVKQDDELYTVVNQTFKDKQLTQPVSITLKKAQCKNGPLEIIVKARDASLSSFGKGKLSTKTWSMLYDSTLPQIRIITTTPSIQKGSSGIIAYTISKTVVNTGIEINEHIFQAFQQPNGTYYCFFPYPIEIPVAAFQPKVFAEDIFGNKNYINVPIHIVNKTFKTDALTISDGFLEKKMPSFADVKAESLLDRYIKVNTKVRSSNEKTLIEISKKTAPKQLWEGNFIALPHSAVKATFGEYRRYFYHDKKIDQQIHMGLDLASTANAPIPASNNGIVVFTDNLGIFGNLVIIDHGLGLQTLYSHLSTISVQEGAHVKKGDIIGYTGTTGLAGGDHLHFGVLIGGIQVSPIEWLDPKWITNNVSNRLNPS